MGTSFKSGVIVYKINTFNRFITWTKTVVLNVKMWLKIIIDMTEENMAFVLPDILFLLMIIFNWGYIKNEIQIKSFAVWAWYIRIKYHNKKGEPRQKVFLIIWRGLKWICEAKLEKWRHSFTDNALQILQESLHTDYTELYYHS